MHAHTAPALFKRHIDDAALAELALQFGMRGFVLKDHDARTTGRATDANRRDPPVRPLEGGGTEGGVTRFIVKDANWSLCKLDLDVQRELIAKGATIEYVACSCVSPIFWEQQPGELAEWIIALRGENLVLGSDLGQFAGPPHPEGLRMLLAALLDVGVPYEFLEQMTKQTPAG